MPNYISSIVSIFLLVFVPETCSGQDRVFLSNVRLQLGTENNLSAAVRAGDVNGDGHVDAVVANGRHWPQQNFLFLNQGRGRFNIKRSLGADQCTSYTCELADLDGDGDLDIAVANDNAPCLVFLNDGQAHFRKHTTVGEPASVRSLTAKDVDGDGDIDLLFTCRGAANRIHFNDGSAKFRRFGVFGTANDSTIDVAVGDIDHDGNNDLILANRDEQPNTILLATGDYNTPFSEHMFQQAKPFGSPRSSSRAVEIADFNGDGNLDWVTANIGSPNTVYLGDGQGDVLKVIQLGAVAGRAYCVAIADMNNDDRTDIVVGNAGQPNEIYFNQGDDGQFTTQQFGQPDAVTYGLCLADFSGDGFIDIAVANSGQLNRVFLNQPKAQKPRTR